MKGGRESLCGYLGKSLLGRRSSKCKGPGERVGTVHFRNGREASVTAAGEDAEGGAGVVMVEDREERGGVTVKFVSNGDGRPLE